MSTSNLAVRVETWLSSTWHVKVPAPWLEACIDWIQQENDRSNLTQAYINRQVFEQWLLTDLRDLEYPLLPDCILNTPKGELSGFYSIQIDSLVDVSQPAYSQLQKSRGKSTINEEITANMQGTQKSWEAKPTRMLMLQLTDGIHHIQGMEYHPLPVLRSNLPPGTKMMIQGKVAYRLGVLLLKPENVRLLGGEVDGLAEEFAEQRVLARLIGEYDSPNALRSNIPECGISRPADEVGDVLAPSDEELLASLEDNDDLMRSTATLESGYCSRSSSSDPTVPSLPSNGNFSQQVPAVFPEANEGCGSVLECVEEDLDEFSLDDVLLLEEIQQEAQVLNRNTGKPPLSIQDERTVQREISDTWGDSSRVFSMKHNEQHTQHLDDCLENRQQKGSKIDGVGSNQKSSEISSNRLTSFTSEFDPCFDHVQVNRMKDKCHRVTLDTPPFTYICVLLNNKPQVITTMKVKAFIVTLTGSLRSSGGIWCVTAKISDGTAYLEVDFADDILRSLIGFSVPEMKQMRKDPDSQQKLKEGLQNCQRELIDLCCLMTIQFNPTLVKATVTVLQDITAQDLNSLKRRLNYVVF